MRHSMAAFGAASDAGNIAGANIATERDIRSEHIALLNAP